MCISACKEIHVLGGRVSSGASTEFSVTRTKVGLTQTTKSGAYLNPSGVVAP